MRRSLPPPHGSALSGKAQQQQRFQNLGVHCRDSARVHRLSPHTLRDLNAFLKAANRGTSAASEPTQAEDLFAELPSLPAERRKKKKEEEKGSGVEMFSWGFTDPKEPQGPCWVMIDQRFENGGKYALTQLSQRLCTTEFLVCPPRLRSVDIYFSGKCDTRDLTGPRTSLQFLGIRRESVTVKTHSVDRQTPVRTCRNSTTCAYSGNPETRS